MVDSGAPVYGVYRTADDRWLSVAAVEPHFYADLVRLLDLPDDLPAQDDRSAWPVVKELVASAGRSQPVEATELARRSVKTSAGVR